MKGDLNFDFKSVEEPLRWELSQEVKRITFWGKAI